MKPISCFVLFVLLAINDLWSQSSSHKQVFQLNHVDICVDSASFNKILHNTFLRDSFSYVKVFVDSTGSEILLLGKESFVHVLPAKGFFLNRTGACLLVHHSFRWQETNRLKEYLQTFTKDSLYNRPYNSPELSIDYINVYEDTTGENEPLKFIRILQNHSKKNYLNWGYSDNDLEQGIGQKKYMADYVGKETKHKLFQNIVEIFVSVTEMELSRMRPLLNAYGYRETANRFILDNHIIISPIKMKANMREVIFTILLSTPVKRRTILINDNTTLFINDRKAIFTYKIPDNYR